MRNKPDPTCPLPNSKHEAFVQALLKGACADAAYASAGYRAHRQNAARLMTNDDIQDRLAHLKSVVTKKVVEATSISVTDVLKELAKLGFSNMRNYARITSGGDAFLDLSKISEDNWAAIQEMTVEEYKDGKGEAARDIKRVRIKLHGKESALVNIGKHLGMFDKDKGSSTPADAPLVPQRPSPERLEEMRRRYMPKFNPHLHAIEGGKQERNSALQSGELSE